MKPSLRRVLLTQLLILVTAAPGVLLAANASDDDVIRNWSAPTYWQPPAAASNGNVSTKAGEAASTVDGAPVPFVALSPCRLVDTRSDHGFPDPYGPPSLSPGITRDFQVTGHCGVPVGATAVSFNFTVVRTLGNRLSRHVSAGRELAGNLDGQLHCGPAGREQCGDLARRDG